MLLCTIQLVFEHKEGIMKLRPCPHFMISRSSYQSAQWIQPINFAVRPIAYSIIRCTHITDQT